MLRRPRRALCSSRLALPPAPAASATSAAGFGYFRPPPALRHLLPNQASGSPPRPARAPPPHPPARELAPPPEPGSEAPRLSPDTGRRRSRRPRRLLPKTPEPRVSPTSQVSVTFPRLSPQRSEVSVCPRVPLRPAPSASSGSSNNSIRPSLWLLPRTCSDLLRRPCPSNRPLPTILTVPAFGSFRRFPDLALGPLLGLSSSPCFGSFRRCHLLTPPIRELRLLPPPLREGLTLRDSFDFFRGYLGSFRLRERKREGGQRRGGSGEGLEKGTRS